MSTSPQTNVTVEEELPLNTIAGSGNTHGNHVVISPGPCGASCCDDKHHRKLAVCSIICGITCIGIKALINSVKVFLCVFTCRSTFQSLELHTDRCPVYHTVCAGVNPNHSGQQGPARTCRDDDGSTHSCAVFKTGQKVWHHLHRGLGLHSGSDAHPDGSDLISAHVSRLTT